MEGHTLRIFAADIEPDACLIENIGVIIVKQSLDSAEQYAAVRALLPTVEPTTIMALIDQIQTPTVSIAALGLDSEV